jgi:WD40 repeat protein
MPDRSVSLHDLAPEAAVRVHAACHRFKGAWQAGQRPRIEDYLVAANQPDHAVLLEELIKLDVRYRRSAGDSPCAEDYTLRFPQASPTWVGAHVSSMTIAAGQRLEAAAGSLPTAMAAGEPHDVIRADGALAPGSSFGTYQLLEEIGRGGMGVVYKARHLHLKRLVALKMIRSGTQARVEDIDRFRREAQAIARLQHPNVVQIFEVGEWHAAAAAESSPFFALEYVDGGSLSQRLAGRPFPPDQAARLTATLAEAVHAAHQQGLVHRDLKPANVLLTADGTPKITDFGLAKQLDAELDQTQTGQVMGTPSYMAPEQAHGGGRAVGPATDVYALGTILYELLTGAPPFRSANVLDTLEQVRTQEPVPPRQIQPKTPRDLETICLKALRKEPGKRYASARALAQDLHAFLDGTPIQARPVGRLERAWRWCRRRRAWAAAAVLAGLLLITVVVGAVAIAIRENQNSERLDKALQLARHQDAKSTLEKALLLCERGDIHHGLLWLVRGLERAVLARDGDLEQAYRWNLGGWANEVHRLERVLPHADVVLATAFSPDGSLLATGCKDGRVVLWNVASGRQVGEPLAHPLQVRTLAFDPRGKLLVTGCDDGKARVWNATTRQLQFPPLVHAQVIRPATAWPWVTGINSVAFGPDGRQFITGGCDGIAMIWETDSGKRVVDPIVSGKSITTVAFHPHARVVLTGGHGWNLEHWDAASGKPVGSPLRKYLIHGAAYSPDGNCIVAGYLQDRCAWRWSLHTGKRIDPPLQHFEAVQAASYSPDGQKVLTGSRDRTARLWEAGSGARVGPPLEHPGPVIAAVFSPDGARVATACEDKYARLWRVACGSGRQILRHGSWVRACAFSPDGKAFLTGGEDKYCRLWDTESGRRLGQTLVGNWPSGVAFSADGKIGVAIETQNNNLTRWELKTGRRLSIAAGGDGEGWHLATDPAGTTIATGALRFGKVRIWDAKTGKPGALLRHGTDAVFGIAVSPDGHEVWTGGEDATVRRWNAATGQQVGPALPQPFAVSALAFAQDGRQVATGNKGGFVQLWNVAPWGRVGLALPHEGQINGLAFVPHSNLLVTGSDDHKGRIWFTPTGHQVGPALRHKRAVHAVAVSPDGRLAGTASDDYTARFWILPTAVGEEPQRVSEWVKALTGLELDEQDSIAVLPPATWQQCRDRCGDLHERPAYLDANAWRELAQEHMRGKHFAAAAGVYVIASKLDSDILLKYDLAIALLGASDLAGYRAVCEQLLVENARTTDVEVADRIAYACVPVAGAIKTPERLLPLARLGAHAWPGNVRILGAAQYRAGLYQEALDSFQMSEKNGHDQRTWDWCFRAMAHAKLGQLEVARSCLAEAVKWYAGLRKREPWIDYWSELVESELLLAEADLVVRRMTEDRGKAPVRLNNPGGTSKKHADDE